jgi:hypothetical protein
VTLKVRNLGHGQSVCALKFDSPLKSSYHHQDYRVNILSTADSLCHHRKLGGGSASISGTSVYRGSKWGRRVVRRPNEQSRIVLPPETGEQPSLLPE